MPDQPEIDVNFKKDGIINSAMEKSPEMAKKVEKPVINNSVMEKSPEMAKKVEKPEKMPGKPVAVLSKKLHEIANNKHAPSQEKPAPIPCKCKPTQDKPVTIKCDCVPTQGKPVLASEITTPQNKTAPIQCKCVPVQCKCPSQEKMSPTQDKSQAMLDKAAQKPSTFGSPQFPMPSLKKSPNTLYRKLLPAVLFVLTFVTVMTILLIYMDTVALGAAQFRVNMSRDYELARIPQGSAPLVAYVRQLHLAPPPPRAAVPPPRDPTPQVHVLDQLYGEIYNGTFIEFLPRGSRSLSTLYLERARGWRGVVARAAPRDYLALRTNARAAHACLSPTQHPREVSYSEGGESSLFRSRVLCLPLYTLLLAGEATCAEYVLLGGGAALPALTHVPYESVRIQVIEIQSSDPIYRNKTTSFLSTKNYTVAASFEESVMYALKDNLNTQCPNSA